ncbi:hypothetical protein DRO97_04690 [Archaeoglobales archaeon]|nr:MAG: hypothetical protein DRO97_04690 [Archaeoglobales archaeon]
MVDMKRVFASLLVRVYAEEFNTSNLLGEILLNVDDENVWTTFFEILKDNNIHMCMIQGVVELLGYNIDEFRESTLQKMGIKEFEFSEEFIAGIIQEVLKWERYAYNFYSHLLKFMTEYVEGELETEKAEKIKRVIIIV